METLYRVADNKAEAMEFRLSGGAAYLKVPLKNLKRRKNVLLAVVIRRGRVIIPCGDDHLEEDDSVIVITCGADVRQFGDVFEG